MDKIAILSEKEYNKLMSVGFNASIGSGGGNADLGRISNGVGSFGGHSVRIGSEAVVNGSELSGISNIPQKSLHQRQVSVVHP